MNTNINNDDKETNVSLSKFLSKFNIISSSNISKIEIRSLHLVFPNSSNYLSKTTTMINDPTLFFSLHDIDAFDEKQMEQWIKTCILAKFVKDIYTGQKTNFSTALYFTLKEAYPELDSNSLNCLNDSLCTNDFSDLIEFSFYKDIYNSQLTKDLTTSALDNMNLIADYITNNTDDRSFSLDEFIKTVYTYDKSDTLETNGFYCSSYLTHTFKVKLKFNYHALKNLYNKFTPEPYADPVSDKSFKIFTDRPHIIDVNYYFSNALVPASPLVVFKDFWDDFIQEIIQKTLENDKPRIPHSFKELYENYDSTVYFNLIGKRTHKDSLEQTQPNKNFIQMEFIPNLDSNYEPLKITINVSSNEN